MRFILLYLGAWLLVLFLIIWLLGLVFYDWFKNRRNIVPGRIETEKERHIKYIEPNFVKQGIAKKPASPVKQYKGNADDLEHGLKFAGKGWINGNTLHRIKRPQAVNEKFSAYEYNSHPERHEVQICEGNKDR